MITNAPHIMSHAYTHTHFHIHTHFRITFIYDSTNFDFGKIVVVDFDVRFDTQFDFYNG